MQENLDLFDDAGRWPRRPYCSDNLDAGVKIRSLKAAVLCPYIQANPPNLRVWMLFDIDRPGGGIAWEDANLPPPSWAAVNRQNRHAHLSWGLTAPVLVDSPDLRQHPLRYLCAVEAAFRIALEADPGFTGLITKNPAHPLWLVLRGGMLAYALGDLARWVDLPKYAPKRKPEEVGLGRNVTVFDWLRHKAYREVRAWKAIKIRGIWVEWLQYLYGKSLERNGDLARPMDSRECWHIAKSVSRWVWKDFDVEASDQRFRQLQMWRGERGGKASGLARMAKTEDKRATACLMAAQGRGTSEIAAELGVDRRTIQRWTDVVRI